MCLIGFVVSRAHTYSHPLTPVHLQRVLAWRLLQLHALETSGRRTETGAA